ncbi:MAG: transporter [Acidobacteria bacterium]|nr:transporter [Acidobacteriota bacterium]
MGLESKPVLTKLGLGALFLTYFLSAFMVNGLSIASPKIAADLNGMDLFSWAISLPALAAAFVTLLYGRLSDLYGRRIMILISLAFFLAGAVLAGVSQTFAFNIVARIVNALGLGALATLCFSVIGDFYAPVQRSKWTGLLQIAAGVAAVIGPPLVGMLTDQLSWRYFFWAFVPLTAASMILVSIGIPSKAGRSAPKIDYAGACVLAIASSTMILGFSFADRRSWLSMYVLGLLLVSLICWCLFIWIERKAEEPILDPQVLTNRTFLTAAVATVLSFFGFVGIMSYYPLFLQGVQSSTATLSGWVLMPFSMLMAFMGVPAGLLLAKTKRYKWMLVSSYGVLTVGMFCMVFFNVETPIWMGVLVMVLAGLGVGSIPTINILIVQFALPKRLLGIAVAAIFFMVAIGQAVTPAIMGSAMNVTYEKKLKILLPREVNLRMDKATFDSLADSRVLMDKNAMAGLEDALHANENLYAQTVRTIRSAFRSGLKTVFLIGAIAMLRDKKSGTL